MNVKYLTDKTEELKCFILLNPFIAYFLVENIHLYEVPPE